MLDIIACRSVRGGSWMSDANPLRSAQRGDLLATVRADTIGFRVARPLD